MTAKSRKPDVGPHKGGGSDPDAAPYPLLFKGSSRKGRKGLMGWVLGFFRTPPEPRAPEKRDRPEELDPLPAPVASGAPAKLPLAVEGHLSSPANAVPHGGSEARNEEPGELGARPGASMASPATDRKGEADTDPSESPLPLAEPAESPSHVEELRPTPLHRATLQMLPGRLQPVDRDVLKQEIRFLRPTNRDQEVTVGRDDAAPPDHVTLDHPSLEPRHARMQYRDGQWWIESLAADDPVRLNDHAIHPRDGRRLLRDGDRVRLGEIEFLFRSP